LHIERDGYVVNRSAIMNCVDTLSKLSDSSDGMTVYKQDLEPEILRQSEAYYKAEAGRLLETCNTLEYLRRVRFLSHRHHHFVSFALDSPRQFRTRLSEEESRVYLYLSLQTLTPLQSILNNTLLTPHLQTIIDMPSTGLDDLVIENLNRLAEEKILPAFPSGLEQDPMQQSQDRERLLEAVHKVWSDHASDMDNLSYILKYMVRPTT